MGMNLVENIAPSNTFWGQLKEKPDISHGSTRVVAVSMEKY